MAPTLDQILANFRAGGAESEMREAVRQWCDGRATDELIAAARSCLDVAETSSALYEAALERDPDDVRALIGLAEVWWLSGRGPDAVGELASRAIASDPGSRAAWHMWAISESDLRGRVARWRQVAERFAGDQLALANLADNAASLAGSDEDRDALALAIETYERLFAAAERAEQRAVLQRALETLRGWRL